MIVKRWILLTCGKKHTCSNTSYAEVSRLPNLLTKPNHNMLQQDLPPLENGFSLNSFCFSSNSFCCSFLEGHHESVFFYSSDPVWKLRRNQSQHNIQTCVFQKLDFNGNCSDTCGFVRAFFGPGLYRGLGSCSSFYFCGLFPLLVNSQDTEIQREYHTLVYNLATFALPFAEPHIAAILPREEEIRFSNTVQCFTVIWIWDKYILPF